MRKFRLDSAATRACVELGRYGPRGAPLLRARTGASPEALYQAGLVLPRRVSDPIRLSVAGEQRARAARAQEQAERLAEVRRIIEGEG